ncbi:MAG: AI-2E family transporter [Bacteroidota bacterium]|nr:AI-2E family transporter [Bacteroidota bacterium]
MQWFKNVAYILIVLIGGGFLLLTFQDLLFPVFFAIFFAFLLMPMEKWIYRRIRSKFASITLSLLLVLGTIGGFLFIFGNQLIVIISNMNSITDQLQDGLQRILKFVDENVPYVEVPADQESLNRTMAKLMEAPISFIGSSITNVALFIFNALLTLIYTVFILIYKESFRDFFMIQFGKDKREEIGVIVKQTVHLIQKYLSGLVIVIIILAFLNCIGLLIIGVEYAIFWGVLAACLVVIPYIGTTLGGTLPFLYAMATGEPWQPWAVVGMYVVIQQLEGNIITPKIVGSSVRINPLFALFAVVVMGSILGIGGIVLAIPTIAVFKLIAEQIDVLKPIALLMDKDLIKKRGMFYGKFDREDFRLSTFLNEEENKR